VVKDQLHHHEAEQNAEDAISCDGKGGPHSEFLEVYEIKRDGDLDPEIREARRRRCNPGRANHDRHEKDCEAADGIERRQNEHLGADTP
jgi:hypothetical protein